MSVMMRKMHTVLCLCICSFIPSSIYAQLNGDIPSTPWHMEGADNQLYRHIYVDVEVGDCRCKAGVKMMLGADHQDELGILYDIDDFFDWYGDSTNGVNNGNLYINEDCGAQAFINIYKMHWPHEMSWGRCIRQMDEFGAVHWAKLEVNNEYSTETAHALPMPNDCRSTIVGHELAHMIGLDHYNDVTGVRNTPYNGTDVKYFTAEDRLDIDIIYPLDSVASCQFSNIPIYDLTIVEELTTCDVDIDFSTGPEAGYSSIQIKKSTVFNDILDNYAHIATIILNSPEGGSYHYDDSFTCGQTVSYALDVYDTSGNVAFTITGSPATETTYNYVYPQSVVQQLRSENISSVLSPYWYSIATEAQIVDNIDTAQPNDCEFLVIACEEYCDEIAPLCNYWEGEGYDVRLLSSVPDQTTSQCINDFIAACHAYGSMRSVLLVGVASEGLYRIVQLPAVEVDGILTDYVYSDVDGDWRIDVPVGRINAKYEEEVCFYVHKELQYHYDTRYNGKKDPGVFSDIQIISVADNYASGSTVGWGEENYDVLDVSDIIHASLCSQFESSRVHLLDATELVEWSAGNTVAYRNAVMQHSRSALEDNRHVVFGAAIHNVPNMFGCFQDIEWATMAEREAQTFWFFPECKSAPHRYLTQYQANPEIFMGEFRNYEMFVSEGLLILGSSDISSRSFATKAMAKLVDRVFENDQQLGHARSIGDIWREVNNEIVDSELHIPVDLCSHRIEGNPMLFVRDVYDPTSGIDYVEEEVDVEVYPNPFNGTINISISGIKNAITRIHIYDLKGRFINEIITNASDKAVMQWNGKDADGREVASGRYFIQLNIGSETIMKRVSYIK